MHEAALAARVADAVRSLEGEGGRLRLLVASDHRDQAAFDVALRLHLAAKLGSVGGSEGLDIEIVHVPRQRLCAACASGFRDADPDALCPRCGGPSLPSGSADRIELEWQPGTPIGRRLAGRAAEEH